MSKPLKQADLMAAAELAVAPAPELKRNVREDIESRHFDLPVSLHTGFFGAFLAYLGIMAVGFPHPEMILPMAIFIFFTVAFYVVPMAWAKLAPSHANKAMPMHQLMGEGIAIESGRASGRDAAVQVLILPVLILGWGIAVVSIAALS